MKPRVRNLYFGPMIPALLFGAACGSAGSNDFNQPGNVDATTTTQGSSVGGASSAAATGADNGCVAGGVDCDADEMAANDIFIWQAEAADSVPDGKVTVAFDGATPPNYTITVSWDEPGENLNYSITIPVRQL